MSATLRQTRRRDFFLPVSQPFSNFLKALMKRCFYLFVTIGLYRAKSKDFGRFQTFPAVKKQGKLLNILVANFSVSPIFFEIGDRKIRCLKSLGDLLGYRFNFKGENATHSE